MFGANIRSAIDQVVEDCQKASCNEMSSSQQRQCLKEAAENMANAKLQAKKYYDKKTIEMPTCVAEGQINLLRTYTKGWVIPDLYRTLHGV